jgi:hypothetical protein
MSVKGACPWLISRFIKPDAEFIYVPANEVANVAASVRGTNPRHEKFAQELAAGKSASEAYVLAGFKKNDGNCIRLKGNERIQSRLAELQDAAARKSEITVESICRELDEANAVAKARGQASAMVSASALRAKLAGLMVERQQVEIGGPGSFDHMTDPREIALAAVDACLEYRIEHYHDLRDGDRERLVELWFSCFHDFSEAVDKLIEEVHARPLKASYKPPKALPSPYLNSQTRR